MSNQTQERIATRLTFAMALLVATSLLLVGWTLYRPGPALSTAPIAVVNH